MESSPRFLNTDSWGEENSVYPSKHALPAASLGSTKLRLMCSNGGNIVPRPHDKSLCYVGGETRMVVVDRHTTLLDLTNRLTKTFRSSSSAPANSFTLKYQLPTEDLDSLISVTTDEDLENMIEEYERLNSSTGVRRPSRLRLFLFPVNPEAVSSIGSLLENSNKSDDWFLNALNGTSSGFSDTSSVNCLLGLDDEISPPEKKDVHFKTSVPTNPNNSGQDVHSIPDSPILETTSSFGSASSSPSLTNLPPVRVNADDHQKVSGGGIEEQFSQMSVVASPAPVMVSGSPMSSATAIPRNSDPFLFYHERSEQSLQLDYLKHQQQQQFQQKLSKGFDLASMDSYLSDSTITDQLSPPVQIQNNNQAADPSTPDQKTRLQIQQQKTQNYTYLPITTTQMDTQHPQLHHQQQLQFIQPPQFIHHHHHPNGVVPVASYYQHHPHHQPPTDQPNFVYYIPASQPPQGYNFPLQQPQPPPAAANPNSQATTLKTEFPAGGYRTTNSGGPQLVRVLSGVQNRPQYVGYSEIHHPSQPQYGNER